MLLIRCSFAKYLVIFFHSNFEDIGRCHSFCRALRDLLYVHVIAVEYPGYGVCPGSQTDARGVNECASTAFRFVREVLRWPTENILVFGRSVVTGPALTLAAQHAVGGLILVSPFLSIKDVGREIFGYMVDLIAERFPNNELMPLVKSPCLIIHGEADKVVASSHGQRLHELCKSRKQLVMHQDLEHNFSLLQNAENFIGPVRDFFSLPECGAEELAVPTWAFDLCCTMFARVPNASPTFFSATCDGTVGGARGCACNARPLQPVGTMRASHDDSREETTSFEDINSAIELVLSGGAADVFASDVQPRPPRTEEPSISFWTAMKASPRAEEMDLDDLLPPTPLENIVIPAIPKMLMPWSSRREPPRPPCPADGLVDDAAPPRSPSSDGLVSPCMSL